MSEVGYIYIATNRDTGRRYVGQTINFRKRLICHRAACRYHFDRALKKYGEERFDFQLIAYRREDLNYWERYFIEKLNTTHPHGYNHTSGGDAKYKTSEEARRKLRVAMTGKRNPFYGRHHTDETKKKIAGNRVYKYGKDHPSYGTHHPVPIGYRLRRSVMMQGEGNPFYGKKHTPETKEKIRAYRVGRKLSEAHKRSIGAGVLAYRLRENLPVKEKNKTCTSND